MDSSNMSEEVIRVHTLILIPIFLPTVLEPLPIEQAIERRHGHLAMTWIKGMFSTDPWSDTNNTMVRVISSDLVKFSLAQADYYPLWWPFWKRWTSMQLSALVGLRRET